MSGLRAARVATLLGLLLTLALTVAACSGGAVSSTSPNVTSPVTPTPTVKPPVVYVALGASDAIGVGATDPNTQGYVPILISHLPTGSQALNLGIGGFKIHDALTEELPQAIAAQPTLVTVWLVGNDFRQCTPLTQYAADLDALLGQLQQKTHAEVFVANTPDMSQLPYFQQGAPQGGACVQGASTDTVHTLALQWNQVIDPIVARHGDVLVDLFTFPLGSHPNYVSRDGFHPSTAGYAVLADIFWTQITAHHGVPIA
jgi:lysophospholipase L1-like esterase